MQIKHLVRKKTTLKQLLKDELLLSSRLIKDLKKNKLISINEEKTFRDVSLFKNDVLIIDLDYENNSYEAANIPIDIVYEDDMILVVNKDSGIVVHPTNGAKTNTLLNAISYYQKQNNQNYKIRFVNRIDMGTSGIVVVAKNKYIMEKLSIELRNRSVVKEYYAVVEGVILDENILDFKLIKDEFSARRIVREDGKASITKIIPISTNGKFTLVKAIPLTGRTHQVRAHLSHVGNIIVGDELYGSKIQNRLMLHCSKMEFDALNLKFEMSFDKSFLNFIKNK